MVEAAQPQSSLSECERLTKNVRVVASIAAFAATVGLGPVALMQVLNRVLLDMGLNTEFRESLYKADPLAHDNITVFADTRQGRFKHIARIVVTDLLPSQLVWATSLRFYLTKKHFSLRSITLAIVSSWLITFVGYGYCGVLLFRNFAFAQTWALIFVAVRFGFPAGAEFFKLLIPHLQISISGVFFVLVVPFFPIDQDWFTFLLLAFAYPLCREITRYASTQCAWYLSSQLDLGGEEISVDLDRSQAWVFVGFWQLVWGVFFRVQVVNVKNPLLTGLVIIWQCALEIFTRLTHSKRDLIIQNWSSRCKTRKGSKVETQVFPFHRTLTKSNLKDFQADSGVLNDLGKPSPSPQNSFDDTQANHRPSLSRISSGIARDSARRSFYSMVILTEMMSEYAGIAISSFCVFFWQSHRLFWIYPYYVSAAGPLDQPPNFTPLYITCLMQLFGELLVDNICVYFEREVDLHIAWAALLRSRSRSKFPTKFAFLYGLAAITATIFATYFSIATDSVLACTGRDICFCVGNGLVKGGFYQTYCKILNPNSTTGAPLV